MSAKDLVIKVAGPEEASTIHHVIMDAYAEYKTRQIPSSALDETQHSISKELSSGHESAAICWFDKKPIGVVKFHTDNGLYFSRLSVISEFRRKGVATEIINWLERYAKSLGESIIWCKVRKDETQNVRLYSKLGFSVVGETTLIKGSNTRLSLVIMSKSLK